MKLDIIPEGIRLREVYSGILFETDSGEEMGICMRDSGFEFSYQGVWYEAKHGIIRKLGSDDACIS